MIYGISGSGKTQLALEFIHSNQGRYQVILWLNAASSGDVDLSFSSCAGRIRSLLSPNQSRLSLLDDRDCTEGWLQSLQHLGNLNWLLVIDGLDYLNESWSRRLCSYAKRFSSGSILVTSNFRGVAKTLDFVSIDIAQLELDAAQNLLLKLAFGGSELSRPDYDASRKIVMLLDCFALAIEQAGALISNGLPLSEFLNAYNAEPGDLMQYEPLPKEWYYTQSIFKTFEMICDSLQPGAAALFSFCSVFGSWQIPIEFLQHLELYGQDDSAGIEGIANLKSILGQAPYLSARSSKFDAPQSCQKFVERRHHILIPWVALSMAL